MLYHTIPFVNRKNKKRKARKAKTFRAGCTEGKQSGGVDQLAVAQHIPHHGLHREGAAVGDDDVGVLAGLQAAHPVLDADVAGGMDGDGLADHDEGEVDDAADGEEGRVAEGSDLLLERDRENDADRYEDENEFAVWRLENSKKGDSY